MTDEPFRILLVEDNPADVYLLEKAMARAHLNFEITVIEDGRRALEFVRGVGKYAGGAIPHLAVIDISLPKSDGIQIVEAIRVSERFAGMPVIVMSSSARSPGRLEDKHLQVARYIPKPPDLEDWLRVGVVIREFLEGRANTAGQ